MKNLTLVNGFIWLSLFLSLGAMVAGSVHKQIPAQIYVPKEKTMPCLSQDTGHWPVIWRCESEEAVCYVASGNGGTAMQCRWK